MAEMRHRKCPSRLDVECNGAMARALGASGRHLVLWHQLWEFPAFKTLGFDTPALLQIAFALCPSLLQRSATKVMGRLGGDGARRLARWVVAYSEVMAIAALMVVPPLAGLFFDRTLGSSPWGVILGAGLGVGSGIARLVRWSASVARRVPGDRSLRTSAAKNRVEEIREPRE